MNEAEFGYRLAGHLSVSSRDVGATVAQRLRLARVGALAVQRQQNLWPLISSGQGVVLRLRFGLGAALRSLAMVMVVLAVFGLGQHWREAARISAHEDIDATLLIDDLPIDAYLDRDFKAWVLRELQS